MMRIYGTIFVMIHVAASSVMILRSLKVSFIKYDSPEGIKL